MVNACDSDFYYRRNSIITIGCFIIEEILHAYIFVTQIFLYLSSIQHDLHKVDKKYHKHYNIDQHVQSSSKTNSQKQQEMEHHICYIRPFSQSSNSHNYNNNTKFTTKCINIRTIMCIIYPQFQLLKTQNIFSENKIGNQLLKTKNIFSENKKGKI